MSNTPNDQVRLDREMLHEPRSVSIDDIDIPFGRLVLFFVKVGLAIIPALMIIWLFMAVVGALVMMLFGGDGWMGWRGWHMMR